MYSFTKQKWARTLFTVEYRLFCQHCESCVRCYILKSLVCFFLNPRDTNLPGISCHLRWEALSVNRKQVDLSWQTWMKSNLTTQQQCDKCILRSPFSCITKLFVTFRVINLVQLYECLNISSDADSSLHLWEWPFGARTSTLLFSRVNKRTNLFFSSITLNNLNFNPEQQTQIYGARRYMANSFLTIFTHK